MNNITNFFSDFNIILSCSHNFSFLLVFFSVFFSFNLYKHIFFYLLKSFYLYMF
jgi:hypothetical protein